MKKTILLILIILIGFIILSGCTKTEEVSEEVKELTAEEVVIKLKEKNNKIGTYFSYTEENDINELLGRPNQYTSKTTFEDLRIEQTNKNLDPEYFSEEEINEPIGGTVEVFENEENMNKRKEYLEEVTSLMSSMAEYSYSRGKYLLRLNKGLTPTQAKEYEEAFYNIIGE